MDLSVVIPTLNKVALLERTLDALAAQDLVGCQWEIVVVDDGSSDATATMLASRVKRTDSRVRPVSPGRNLGRAAARNYGARRAAGRYLLFLDDDIVAPPGLLSAHLALLVAHPGDGTIGYAVTEPSLIDAPHFHYLDTRAVAKLTPGPAPAKYFVTQNAAVPRAAFLSIDGFDEEFAAYGFEDMEVAFRLEDSAGVSFHALKQPVPQHVHHHTLAEYFAKKRECGSRSLSQLADKHPDRLAEMGLHLVIDPSPQRRAGWPIRLLRHGARGWPGRTVQALVRRWPTGGESRPRWPWLYFRLMDLAVFACFQQGLSYRSDTGSVLS